VTLRLSAADPPTGAGVASMRVRNDGGPWTPWEPFATTRSWTLTSANGTRAVYAEFRDAAGNISRAAADAILLDRSLPNTTSTSQALVPNAMFGTSTAVVQLAWTASDTISGVGRYHVQQSISGRPWTTVALPGTSRLIRALTHGYTYQFRVRAQDRAGNWGAWRYAPRFNVFVRQETSTAILYGGAWRRLGVVGASAGYVKFARTAGARARRVVSGRSVALVSSRGPNRGKAAIYLDGSTRAAAVIDLYAPTTQVRRVVFAKSWPTWGFHTIEVRLLGTRNVRSWGTRVDLDALVALW
jgi:hypothetical protein